MSTIATYAGNSQAIQEPSYWDVAPLEDSFTKAAHDILAGIEIASSSLLEFDIILDIIQSMVEQSASNFNWLLPRRLAGIVSWKPASDALSAQQAKNEAVIHLLGEWLADDSGYDEWAWPIAKRAIEENRLSYRTRFHE